MDPLSPIASPTPQGPQGTNPFAVASLVLGILTPLGGVPGILSVIFGIIALTQIPERRQRGQGLAIGGLAATGVWLVTLLGLIAIGLAVDSDSREDGPEGDPVSATSLSVGDCLVDIPDGERVSDLNSVSCSEPHGAEVYDLFDLPEGDYPGENAVIAEADRGCVDALEDLPAAHQDQQVGTYYLYPTPGSWRVGDREVVCIAWFMDGERTGSLRD